MKEQQTMGFGLPSCRVGLLLTDNTGRFFLVKRVNDDKWSLPWAYLRKDEDIEQAAERAGMEQTYYDYDMNGACYVDLQHMSDALRPSVLVIYGAEHPYDISLTDMPDPEIISEMGWFDRAGIAKLSSDDLLHDAEAILGAIDNLDKNVTMNIGDVQKWGLPWFRAGALVYNGERKILMMHEARVKVKKIKDPVLKQKLLDEGYSPSDWVDSDGGWNFPAGRLKVGEGFKEGIIREIKEESGWNVEIEGDLYTKQSKEPGNEHTMPVYLASAFSGPEQFQTWETSEIGWFTPEEIREMNDSGVLRSPGFIMKSLELFEKL